MEHREYWYWLLSMENLGTAALRRLFDRYGTPEEIWQAKNPPLTDIQRAEFDRTRREESRLCREYEECMKKGICMVTAEDAEYPERLRPIYDAPYGLFVLGQLPRSDRPAAAIVGARRCTHHGQIMAEKIGEQLARAGILVISGMAAGIDSSGHRGALQGGGETFAVLGCGVDICYPASNRTLYEEILSRGGILSEYPPGRAAKPFFFPLRNRIISGLSDLVLVVEAREKSGSLITMELALDQGKEVMAVPGRPDDPLSVGCNRLIREGAAIYTEVGDILSVLGIERKHKKAETLLCSLSDAELRILSLLSAEPKHLEQLSAESGLEISTLVALLLQLELKGCVRQVTAGQYLSAHGFPEKAEK